MAFAQYCHQCVSHCCIHAMQQGSLASQQQLNQIEYERMIQQMANQQRNSIAMASGRNSISVDQRHEVEPEKPKQNKLLLLLPR